MVKSTSKISVPGFLANGVSAGIKGGDQKDLGLIFPQFRQRWPRCSPRTLLRLHRC